MAQTDDFSGYWHSCHWYPTQDDAAEETGEYDLTVHRQGQILVFESLPNKAESYMIIRVRLDEDVATGTWLEHAAPSGVFQGMEYSGAGQMLVAADGKSMKGLWAGAGVDHNDRDKPRIYTGRWELRYIGEEKPPKRDKS